MSQREDLLFCKIAISNGLITQEQAQKALAICNKREGEEGRRPLIGAVLTKYNLMRSQEVQRIYDAIHKRTGSVAGAARTLQTAAARGVGKGAGGRGRGGAERGGARGGKRESGSRGVDPSTLWMGIGFGVVFLGVVVAILVMLVKPGTQEGPKAGQLAQEGSSAAGTGSTGAVKGGAKAPPGAGPKAAAGGQVLTLDLKKDYTDRIQDGRRDLTDDPQRGLQILERLKKELLEKQKQYNVSEYLEQVEALLKDLAQAVKEEGGAAAASGGAQEAATAGGGGSAPPEAKSEAAKPEAAKSEPAKPEPAKAGETPPDDELPDLEELEAGDGKEKGGAKEDG